MTSKKTPSSSSKNNDKALKHLFNSALLTRMAQAIKAVYPSFQEQGLIKLKSSLDSLEMKDRVRRIRDELRTLLPQDFDKALTILLKSLKQKNLSGFDLWPYTEFVQKHGLDKPELSLNALKEMTQIFTSEWAVRPFLIKYPQKTLAFLNTCSQNKNVHLRRWASEGTRPRLPWGEKLHTFIKNPKLTLPILESLKLDQELYVQKSVANHLNDIAKDHPDLVLRILKKWQAEASKNPDKDATKRINWITHRALRTLIKNGNSGALELIGVSQKSHIEIVDFKLDKKKIKMGDELSFEFKIRSLNKNTQKLLIDYRIHFVKSNHKSQHKVFKLKTTQIKASEELFLRKKHSIKPITTRRYYSGLHRIDLQINGQSIDLGKHGEWHLFL